MGIDAERDELAGEEHCNIVVSSPFSIGPDDECFLVLSTFPRSRVLWLNNVVSIPCGMLVCSHYRSTVVVFLDTQILGFFQVLYLGNTYYVPFHSWIVLYCEFGVQNFLGRVAHVRPRACPDLEQWYFFCGIFETFCSIYYKCDCSGYQNRIRFDMKPYAGSRSSPRAMNELGGASPSLTAAPLQILSYTTDCFSIIRYYECELF